jgi:hypothetical protein
MLKITPNKKWKEADELFRDILKRYDWFLFEFGRKITAELYDSLLGEIKAIHGSEDYRKRIAVAEIRDRGGKYWFATVVRAERFGQTKTDSSSAILTVIARYPSDKGDDPIRDILQAFGPWTVDTLPYVPSERVATVKIDAGKPKEVANIRKKNMKDMPSIQKAMDELDIPFDPRVMVMSKLKVVEEFEKWVNGLEFGLSGDRHPHWSKAIRKAKVVGLRKLMKDKGLMNVLTDPTFKKYRVKNHFGPTGKMRMTEQELKGLEKFQKRLLRSLT